MELNHFPIHTLRFNKLVYVRNLKCASTFFFENFLRKFNWQIVEYTDINWDEDCVFGHIIDPIQRRHKGIAEFIDMCGLSEMFLNNKKLQTLVSSTLYLDRHSLPYQLTFGERCNDINWLPACFSNEKNIIITQNFLKSKGITINLDDWDYVHAHITKLSSNKKNVEKLLIKLWNNNLLSSEKYEEYKNTVWLNFYNNSADQSWPICDNYKNFNLLPIRIRQELAVYHKSDDVQISLDLNSVNILIFRFLPTYALGATDVQLLTKDINLFDTVRSKY